MGANIVCFCNRITKKQLEKAIIKHSIINLNELSLATGAGSSCGKCRISMEQILKSSMEAIPDMQIRIPWIN
ncbi:(2Fe-2S)-binding protein [Natronoflexus pectinivorans]|uniref:BFD-like [2Fe-2S] binding protein n=1 Tax=Natronoflexus pectinivorans TaxID=682526 RepID=A0A4R2GFE3_9BACT|nr:(2Fe-2S)-binding protein [Natronoflexus pectinivorans]TCO06928.1 BFD-like [2Fe-2S] binding protein [Natronoflexus pectinivorans]